MCFQKRKSALVGVFLEKNPMTNKIEKFLYILEHLIPDGHDEIPTFALYHPLLHQAGWTACGTAAAGSGGSVAGATCDTFTAGAWEQSHQLSMARWYHVSWRSPAGVLIIGGSSTAARRSTELLSATDSTTSPSFTLPYDTRCIQILLIHCS